MTDTTTTASVPTSLLTSATEESAKWIVSTLLNIGTYDLRFSHTRLNEAIADLVWGKPIVIRGAGGRSLMWDCGGVLRSEAPDFVNHLEAALLLVDRDWRYKVGRDVEGKGYASVETSKIIEAATPELALCIAAISYKYLKDRDSGSGS